MVSKRYVVNADLSETAVEDLLCQILKEIGARQMTLVVSPNLADEADQLYQETIIPFTREPLFQVKMDDGLLIDEWYVEVN